MVDFLNPVTLTFIKDVGFPITLVLILLSGIAYMIKKDEKRQERSDNRYDVLVDKFVLEIKDISDKHNKALDNHDNALKEMSNDLKNVSLGLKDALNKLGDYMQQRDQAFSKVIEEINDVKEDINKVKDCIERLRPKEHISQVPREYRKSKEYNE